MAKFHVNPKTGDPGECRATKACPFGGPEEHFTAAAEARKHYEKQQEAAALPAAERKTPLREPRDYLTAAAEGYFTEANPLATEEERARGARLSVQEALGYGESLRGFSTGRLLDQLSPSTTGLAGRHNASIQRELRARVSGETSAG